MLHKTMRAYGGTILMWRGVAGWYYDASKQMRLSPPRRIGLHSKGRPLYMTVRGVHASGWRKKMKDARRAGVRALAGCR